MNNQSGQSLIQVLVSVAIMGVVLTAMTSMFGSLNRESKAMSEKLAAMDLEKVLIGALSDGSACLYALNNPTPILFDSNATVSDTAPLKLPLPSSPSDPARLHSSHDSAAATPLGPVIAQVGQAAAPYSSSLIVSGISLEVTGIGGASITGRWRIDFDHTKLARSIKPVYVSVALKADISNPTNARFTGCQLTSGASGGSGTSGEFCGAFIGDGSNISNVVMPCKGTTPACPSGMILLSPGVCRLPSGIIFGYDASTVCPANFTLKELMTIVTSVTPGTPDSPGSVNYSKFLTCTPN